MKIVCKSSSQVPGYGIVTRGMHIDWPDGQEFPPQVLGNFVMADTGAKLVQPKKLQEMSDEDKRRAAEESERQAAADRAAKEQAEKEKAEAKAKADQELIRKTAQIGRDKLEARLESEGVPHDANLTATQLATLLLRHQGAISC